jgi:hypothetical protein
MRHSKQIDERTPCLLLSLKLRWRHFLAKLISLKLFIELGDRQAGDRC